MSTSGALSSQSQKKNLTVNALSANVQLRHLADRTSDPLLASASRFWQFAAAATEAEARCSVLTYNTTYSLRTHTFFLGFLLLSGDFADVGSGAFAPPRPRPGRRRPSRLPSALVSNAPFLYQQGRFVGSMRSVISGRQPASRLPSMLMSNAALLHEENMQFSGTGRAP